MATFLTILACFAGTIAFAFGVAGLVGLMTFEPPKEQRGWFLPLLDHLVTGGAINVVRDMARNWPERVTERRLLYAGMGCGSLCILLVIMINRIS